MSGESNTEDGPSRPSGHSVPTGMEGGEVAGAPGPPPPEPSHAERCRTLVAGSSRGALPTIAADPAGYPYGSVASYGLDERGNPLFFVSLMAEHTQNALRDLPLRTLMAIWKFGSASTNAAFA